MISGIKKEIRNMKSQIFAANANC